MQPSISSSISRENMLMDSQATRGSMTHRNLLKTKDTYKNDFGSTTNLLLTKRSNLMEDLKETSIFVVPEETQITPQCKEKKICSKAKDLRENVSSINNSKRHRGQEGESYRKQKKSKFIDEGVLQETHD
jgi:hypothetical protein